MTDFLQPPSRRKKVRDPNAPLLAPTGSSPQPSPSNPALPNPSIQKPDLATRVGQGIGQLGRAGATVLAAPHAIQGAINNRVGTAGDRLAAGVTSGFTGKPIIPRPDFSNVSVHTDSVAAPARNPASQGASAGATAPAGGVPAPLPRPDYRAAANAVVEQQRARAAAPGVAGGGLMTGGTGVYAPADTNLRPGYQTAASSIDANGVPTYDNRSVERMLARDAGPGGFANGAGRAARAIGRGEAVNAYGGVADGGLPRPQINQPVTSQQPNLNVPALDLPSVNTGRVSDAERERQKAVATLDSAISAIGPLTSRGKRQYAADLLGLKTNLTAQAGNLAGSAAGTQLDAATRAGTATQSEVGANQRALLGDLNNRDLEAQRQAGETQRALLPKPQTINTDNGNLLQVTGNRASPVLGQDGKPVSIDSPAQRAARKDLQDAYSKLAEQAAQFLPLTGEAPTEADIGTARIRAAQLAGYDLRRDSSGAMHVQIGGRWLPL